MRYDCHICGESVGGKTSARHHIRVEHRDSDIEVAQIMCPECGVEFYARADRADARRFCSTNCRGEWESRNLCGEDSPVWKGGEVDYGSEWPEQREAVLERDSRTCQDCGANDSETGRQIEVHHKVPVRAFESLSEAHRLDNLVTLCSTCHGLRERGGPRES